MSIMGISGCSSSIGYSLDGRCGGNMVDNWGCRGCNGVDIRYWGGYGVDISGINMDIRFGNDISVNVRFGNNIFMNVSFGSNVFMNIRFGSDVFMNVGFGSNVFMNIRFGFDIFMNIRFGGNIFMNVRFGSNFFMDVGFGKRVHLTGEIIRVHSNGSMDNGGGVGISGMSQRSGGIGMRVGISASNQTVPGMTVV